jgi:hypothetical protein
MQMEFQIIQKLNLIEIFSDNSSILHVKVRERWFGRTYHEIFDNNNLILKSSFIRIGRWNDVKVADIFSGINVSFFYQQYKIFLKNDVDIYGLKWQNSKNAVCLITKNGIEVGSLIYSDTTNWYQFLTRKPRNYSFNIVGDNNKDLFFIFIRLLVEFPKFYRDGFLYD